MSLGDMRSSNRYREVKVGIDYYVVIGKHHSTRALTIISDEHSHTFYLLSLHYTDF